MTPQDIEQLNAQLENMKSGVREIVHDISNPLGVLRMAAYYLQNVKADKEKQDHYLTIIAETVDKVDVGLKRLRALALNPSLEIRGAPPDDNKQ
jgi:nitrogen-specific signal transduction histidine kinase